MLLSEGQMSDFKGAALMLPAMPRAKELLADKGYDADWFREALATRKIAACIPSKSNRKAPIPHDAVLYKQRHKIENMFGRPEAPNLRRWSDGKTTNQFSCEVRTRAIPLVFEQKKDHSSRWGTVTSIAAKIGCTAQSLSGWVKKAEIDSGGRGGVPAEIAERLKALEPQIRKLRRANESCARRRPVLPRRSSTAGSSHDRLHRRSSSGLRGRADL
jgi:transposase